MESILPVTISAVSIEFAAILAPVIWSAPIWSVSILPLTISAVSIELAAINAAVIALDAISTVVIEFASIETSSTAPVAIKREVIELVAILSVVTAFSAIIVVVTALSAISPVSITSGVYCAYLTIDHAGPEASVTEANITSFTRSGTKLCFLIDAAVWVLKIGSITLKTVSLVIVSIV